MTTGDVKKGPNVRTHMSWFPCSWPFYDHRWRKERPQCPTRRRGLWRKPRPRRSVHDQINASRGHKFPHLPVHLFSLILCIALVISIFSAIIYLYTYISLSLLFLSIYLSIYFISLSIYIRLSHDVFWLINMSIYPLHHGSFYYCYENTHALIHNH